MTRPTFGNREQINSLNAHNYTKGQEMIESDGVEVSRADAAGMFSFPVFGPNLLR